MQGEASVLSSVSKSTQRNYTSGIERSQAELAHLSSSADVYEKYVFSLVAEANRTKKVHSAVRLFEYFFILIQLILSSYNDFIPYGDTEKNYTNFLKVFYFGFIGTADDVIPFMIALSVIDLLTGFFFALSVIDFHVTHEYRKWMIYVLRVWHGHIFGVLLIPNFLMIMKGFAYLGLHNDALGYVIVILTSICGCVSIWIYLTILPFFSRSPYLSPSPVHAWNIKRIYTFLLISAIPMGLESFLNDQFDEWIETIPLFLMIAIFIYLIYELCSLPFKGILFNAITFGCFNGVILGAIFSTVEAISEGVNDAIFYGGPVILTVVSSIVIYFIIKSYREKVKNLLSYSSFNEPGVRPTEEMKKLHLMEMKIKNKKKGIMLIQIGFEEMCDMFVDWSLCKHLFEQFSADDDLIAYISWLASLFPSEIQFLHKLITHGTKIVGISIDNRCLFFQIHRIHIFRQSSTSRETSNDFNKVKMITDQTISAFCKYWLNLVKPNNEFKTSIYHGLAMQKQQAEAAWSEALDKYPNNPRFAQEHALFLLEVGCNFRESIKQNQNAQQLENGLRMQNDKTFHHFVLSYPKYLKSGVVDTKGNLKGPQIEKNKLDLSATSNSLMSSTRKSISKSSSSNINSDSSDDSSSDQIDLQEGARFLPQMNLRLALQRAVNGLKANIITKIMISALLRAVLTIIFIVICILMAKPLFNSRIDLFNIYYKLDKMEHSYSLLSIQLPWLMHLTYFDKDTNYSKFKELVSSLWDSSNDDPEDTEPAYYKVLNQIESQIDIKKPLREVIAKLSLETINEINEFNNVFYKIDATADKRLAAIKHAFYENEQKCYSCVINETTGYIEPLYSSPSLTTIDYAIRAIVLELRLLTKDNDTTVESWGTDSSDFCDMYVNQNMLSNMIKIISASTSKSLEDIYSVNLSGIFTVEAHSTSKEQLISKIKLAKKNKLIEGAKKVFANKKNGDKIVKMLEDDDNSNLDNLLTIEAENDLKNFPNRFKPKHHKQTTRKKNNSLESIRLRKEYVRDNNSNETAFDNEILAKKRLLLEEEGDNEEEEVEEEEEEDTDPIDTVCNFIIAFSPFILCLFILPSIIYLKDGLEYEMTTFSNVLQNVPKADCLKAGERIKPIEYKENQTKSKKTTKKKQASHLIADASAASHYPFWLFDVVSALIIIVFLIVFAITTQTSKNKIEDYMQYYSLFIAQRNCLYNLHKDITFSLLFVQTKYQRSELNLGTNGHTDPLTAFIFVIQDVIRFQAITDTIDTGDEINGVTSSILGDKEINRIRFQPICEHKITTNIPVDNYKCSSLDRTISFYMEMVADCIAQFVSTGVPMFLPTSLSPYLTHMLDSRIGIGYSQLGDRFKVIFDAKIKSFNTLLIVIPIISIVFTLLTFSLELILIISVKNQFSVFKSLMLRINPISFVANNQLISLVYGKNDKVSQIVSASHAVFTTSPDAMISLNHEGVIEYLNPSTTSIFGYTPEQMLGQHIKLLLNDESKERQQLFYQMQLMQSGQTSLIYECKLKGTRDDGTVIYLKVTLIGFSSNNRIAETFGMMCRDMTNEITQKNAVEKAKKQSEQLLLQILPKDIIMRLNRGDTDISFTVQSSTIAFIDIEKFSNYSASLSASEIMQNLGLVFTAYDQLLAKYSLIIKIKLIGDDYMLAAGLFNQEVEPSKHATQVVNFTLECLDAIEDLNEQLNASLQVRIGVNSGGPLIAGVLGTDKPLFDIIGDPINVASRLQSTDIPGFVQISQQTYDYVANNNELHIEQRGEVELKGKGKQMTYLVHPHQRDNHHVADEDSQASMDLPSSSGPGPIEDERK